MHNEGRVRGEGFEDCEEECVDQGGLLVAVN